MRPIPVLIVDDEYLIRSLVRNSLDWESYGCSIVGEAEDGEQALLLASELKPRLAIVDINIPFINGLDLSLRLKTAHPGIRVIILTGYEDFHFARTAIKIGVVDYLLKPINSEELGRAVNSAIESLLREDEEARSLRTDAFQSKEDSLRSLLSGEAGSLSGGDAEASRFDIDLEAPLVLCLFDADPIIEPETIRSFADFPCELFSYRDGTVALLANEDDRTIRLKDKSYYAVCESVVAHAAASGAAVSVGVSRPVGGASRAAEAYAQALSALEDAFYLGPNHIHPYTEKTPASESAPPSLPARASMIMMLRSGNVRELVSLTRALFRDLARGRAARGYCEMLCLEIVLVVGEFLKDVGSSVNDLLDTEIDCYRLVRDLATLSDMERWLVDLIERSGETGDASGLSRTRLVVRKAKSFIEKNYSRKQMTLDTIAEQAAVGSSYLSSVFKKELGVSVIEFLTDMRLDAAKRLMDDDPLTTIIEVADRVGYSDPYYFSKCFRKRFGSAPTAYLRKKAHPLSTKE